MKSISDVSLLHFAQGALQQEIVSLSPLVGRLDRHFTPMLKHLATSKGKVVLSGIGKSGFIAQKITSTLNSTGTLACYLHPAEAVHGDLGLVQKHDTLLVLSNSGETPEIKYWLPRFKKKHKIIAIVGTKKSSIAKIADWTLDANVDKEICPLNLAPTTSAVAQLIWGDVIAASLMYYKQISSKDFAKTHPGGMLGKKYFLTCCDLAKSNSKSDVHQDASFLDIISAISKSLMGAVAVINEQQKIVGIITDGDLRRSFAKKDDITILKAKHVMTKQPVFVLKDTLANDAFTILQTKGISQLLLVDHDERYAGMIHLHQLLNEGFLTTMD